MHSPEISLVINPAPVRQRSFVLSAYCLRRPPTLIKVKWPTLIVPMDGISGIASLSQLAVYVNCTVTRLSHLYKTISTATCLAKSQLEELHVLLKILERIKRHHSPSDTELLVPILVSIANTVQTLENWFSPSSNIRLQWNLIAHKADIEEALRLLRQKCNLLAFYYSEQNNSALSRIESSLNARHHAVPGSSVDMPSSDLKDKGKRTRRDGDRASGSTAPRGGEPDWHALTGGSSTLARGAEMILYRENRAPSPSASDNSQQPSTSDAQSSQFSGKEEGGPSKREGPTTTKIKVSDITCIQSKTRVFNIPYYPTNNFEGEVTKVKTNGGEMDIGCGSPHQGGKKRTRKKHPPTSSRAAEKEAERVKEGQKKM